jgi:putative transcriptional regulator
MIDTLEDGDRDRDYPWTLVTDAEWDRLDAMTEEELHQNALDDPDNPPLTDEQLTRMRRVPNSREIRERLGMTQREFARAFHIALDTLRDWEQGVRWPDSTAQAYLWVIEENPEAVLTALRAPMSTLSRLAKS